MMTGPVAYPMHCPPDCGTFFLCVAGPLRAADVSVLWQDASESHEEAELHAMIDSAWSAAQADAQLSGARLFDGRLCRLQEYALTDGQLHLTLTETSYRKFLGTNSANPAIRFTHGPEALADPLGVSGLVLTSDGTILLPRRSRTVAEYPDRLHPFGGCVEPGADAAPPDPFATIANELTEETGIAPPLLREAVCLGLLRDKRSYQPEMVFDLSVAADGNAVRQFAAEAVDAHEHAEIVAVDDDPVAVAAFIEQHLEHMTPATPGALILHGRRHWGESWYTAVLANLKTRTQG